MDRARVGATPLVVPGHVPGTGSSRKPRAIPATSAGMTGLCVAIPPVVPGLVPGTGSGTGPRPIPATSTAWFSFAIQRISSLALCLLLLAPPVAAAPLARVVSLNLCTDQWLVLLAPEKVAGLTFLARDPSLSVVADHAARFPTVRASAEAVLALKPDLVVGGHFGATTTLKLLEQSGVAVARFELPADFPGIGAGLRAFAARLDVPLTRAEALIAAMDAALPPLKEPSRDALVWEPRGWTAGPGGLMDAILAAASLRDRGTGARVGVEGLTRDPPNLLVMNDTGPGPSLATAMLAHPAVRDIAKRTIPTAWTICPGPFSAAAAQSLAR